MGFSVGSILGRAFSIWTKNIVAFTTLTAIAFSPIILYAIVALTGSFSVDDFTTFTSVLGLGSFILSMLATGAITYGVFEELRGRHASTGQCLAVGLSRLFPIIGTGLLAVLCVMGGMILFIVPGIILMCMLWLAVPVCVVEQTGGIAALKRSRELTYGCKGTIFGVIFVLGLINFGVGLVLQESVLDVFDPGTWKIYLILALVLNVVYMTIQAVANAIAYHDIRIAREGVDTDALASVFD
jgi:hypothetical protein